MNYLHVGNDCSFPWRTFTREELKDDFFNLRRRIDKDNLKKYMIPKCIAGYNTSNYFFQKERMKIKSQNKISAIEFWKTKKKYIIEYQKNNKGKDLLGTIVFLNLAPAQFPPYAAAMVYKYFGATKVFDPYSGWGDRCVAALAMNIDYVGCDSNTALSPCYAKMIHEYDKYSDSHIDLYFDKTERVMPYPPEGTDLLFTSPPFFNENNSLVEEYYNTENDYDLFMRNSLIPIVKNALSKSVTVCLYIPENMYKYLYKYVGKASKKIFMFKRSDSHNGKSSKSNTIYCWE